MLPTIVILAVAAWAFLLYMSYPDAQSDDRPPQMDVSVETSSGSTDLVLPPSQSPGKVASITSATTSGVPVVGVGGTPVSAATGLPPPSQVTMIPTAAPKLAHTLSIVDAKSGDVTPKTKVIAL